MARPYDIKAEYAANMGNTIGLWEEQTENHFTGQEYYNQGMRVIYVKSADPTVKKKKNKQKKDQKTQKRGE